MILILYDIMEDQWKISNGEEVLTIDSGSFITTTRSFRALYMATDVDGNVGATVRNFLFYSELKDRLADPSIPDDVHIRRTERMLQLYCTARVRTISTGSVFA